MLHAAFVAAAGSHASLPARLAQRRHLGQHGSAQHGLADGVQDGVAQRVQDAQRLHEPLQPVRLHRAARADGPHHGEEPGAPRQVEVAAGQGQQPGGSQLRSAAVLAGLGAVAAAPERVLHGLLLAPGHHEDGHVDVEHDEEGEDEVEDGEAQDEPQREHELGQALALPVVAEGQAQDEGDGDGGGPHPAGQDEHPHPPFGDEGAVA